jgi:hypothetical protein
MMVFLNMQMPPLAGGTADYTTAASTLASKKPNGDFELVCILKQEWVMGKQANKPMVTRIS